MVFKTCSEPKKAWFFGGFLKNEFSTVFLTQGLRPNSVYILKHAF